MIAIGVRTISSRSGTGPRVATARVGDGAHGARDIDPDEASNMPFWLAFE